MDRSFALVVSFAVTVGGLACMERELQAIPPGVQSGTTRHIGAPRSPKVDLLVLVDNSSSMSQEQTNLANNMPGLIEALTNPGDVDGDGQPEPAVQSLHIGVVSSDLGTGGEGTLCPTGGPTGDDGVLRPLCDQPGERFLVYDAADPSPTLAEDFACLATLGTEGCGFEQQLAAVERALTVHAAPDAVNDGFLRDDALLAVLYVTDEEDCSVSDTSIFSTDDAVWGPRNLRCFLHPEAVRPVDQFVAQLINLKPGGAEDVVVAAIVGVPTDLVRLTDGDLAGDLQTDEDFERILLDARMVERIDNSPEVSGQNLVPSCDVAGLGKAYPPRRIVDLVRQIDREGAGGVVQSICQEDWQPTMRAITRLIGGVIDGACLARPLQDASGRPLASGDRAECMVRETLEGAGECGPGKVEVASHDGRTVCQICQQGDGEGAYELDALGTDLRACAQSEEYWYYTLDDPNCGARGKVQFTQGVVPAAGSDVRLECLTTIGEGGGSVEE